MLFRYRKKPTLIKKIKNIICPPRGRIRSFRYLIKRILRLSSTSHSIALGISIGVFASFTPLIGFHFIISFSLAYFMRANMIAAAIGTSVGNPFTFPIIWTSTFKLGQLFLKKNQSIDIINKFNYELKNQILQKSIDKILFLIKPMLIGAIPLGLISSIIVYIITYKIVKFYKIKRKTNLENKRLLFSKKKLMIDHHKKLKDKK